jgi:hypothetical protein
MTIAKSPLFLILLLTTTLLVAGWRLINTMAASIPASTTGAVIRMAAISDGQAAGQNTPELFQLVLTKTVGLDPHTCASSEVITVPVGTLVTYCYRVKNTGNEDLVNHSLVDDHLGAILNNFNYNLVAGAGVFLTQTAQIDADTTNNATWTGETADGRAASSSDTATVYVTFPAVALTKTVGLDPHACASTTHIRVTPGTPVTYCYLVENTGDVDLVTHTLIDDQLGTILDNFSYTLVPSASAYLTQTATINGAVTNSAVWSASTTQGAEVSSNAAATVEAFYFNFLPAMRNGPAE